MQSHVDILPLCYAAPGGLFTGFVVNVRVATAAHKDGDVPFAVCVLIVFGDFEEGCLCLYEAGLVFDLRPGSVFIFPSARLTHFNLHFKGERGSVVLHIDKDQIRWKKDRNSWHPHLMEYNKCPGCSKCEDRMEDGMEVDDN